MTSQAEADEQGHQIGEIRRKSGADQTADAFGRLAWDRWRAAMQCDFPPWDKLAAIERTAWIASAAAVRKAEQDLVKGATE